MKKETKELKHLLESGKIDEVVVFESSDRRPDLWPKNIDTIESIAIHVSDRWILIEIGSDSEITLIEITNEKLKSIVRYFTPN